MRYAFRGMLVGILLVVTSGCGLLTSNDELDYFWKYHGEMTALANGEPWEAKPIGVHREGDPYFHVSGDIHDLPGIRFYPGRFLSLGWFAMEPSRIKLRRFSPEGVLPMIYYHAKQDYDVAGDSYYLLEEYDNWVEIEWFDAESRWVQGRFQLTVAKDPDRPKFKRIDPDTIHFTEGRFNTYVWDLEDYDRREREALCLYLGRCP